MKSLKRFAVPLVLVCLYIALGIWSPAAAQRSTQVLRDYLTEMVLIMPPVFILMGLMEVWIPKRMIETWMGAGSGVRGGLISILLGTLPTGPLYIAFPMAAALLHKGASVTNMILFLGSWAALKIPQLMVEISFLGIEFAALRFVLTLTALAVIGKVTDLLLRHADDLPWREGKQ
jgi:uncharacterized membrane protein YraQ (UPF0718 family)